jgi:hypothetical protein
MITNQVENQETTQEQISSHEAEMIAKVDNAEAAALEKDSAQFGEDEALLAGKYKSPEELEKAYKELEARLGKTEDEPKADDEPAEVEETVPSNEDEAQAVAEEKGFDLTELNKEFADAGSLSEDTYKMLADKGLGKDTVDAYIAGQQALAERNVQELHAVAGGTEQFNEMVEWANDNLPESEIDALNQMVSKQETAKFALQGLYARYRSEAGEPNLIDNGTTAVTNSRGYASTKEMTREMADPRYRTDPAFRKQVEMKIARSQF